MIHFLVRLLMLLVLLGTMGDVWSTSRALAKGAVEANPIMAFLMRMLESKWVIARMLFGLGTIYTVIHSPALAETWKGAAAFGFNSALLIFVIWNNIKVGNSQK